MNVFQTHSNKAKEKNLSPEKNEQQHDALFKVFFSDSKIAKNYLLHYTPTSVHQHIDFAFFEKSNTAFVDGRFGISFCDVVYETRLRNGGGQARLLFLFEHKSYLPAQPIHLQLLDYLLQFWEDDLKNRRPLSCIIPIVVYHGVKGWKQKPFTDYFPGIPENWQAFIPNFHYLLTDLSQIPPQMIKGKAETEYLRNLFLVLKFARNRALIKEYWQEIFTFGVLRYTDDRQAILLQTLTFYIVNLMDMTQKEFKTLNKQLARFGS
ncbi:MAG: Rpn family recombination-promoting nuclease/putative transposase [Lewinellaceae bacterium]|nr:Rpn family recombination-promoting nuclease/putative transposase [Lewinellaceae bacterium]